MGPTREGARVAFDVQLTRRAFGGAALSCVVEAFGSRASAAESAGLRFTGVNLAGAEFGKIPGTFGVDYTYPTPQDVDYFAGLGFNLIRVPFRWERLQPTLRVPFDAAEQTRLTGLVAYATGKGLHVVLDTHNYARRRVAEDGWTADHIIGSQEVPPAAFANFCGRLASTFRDSASVTFGLMNEPWGIEPEAWLQIANEAVAALRREKASQLVLVPGVAYTGAHSWISARNTVMSGFEDPGQNFAFEVHQYLDQDSSGTSATAVSPTIGSERIDAFQAWCRQNRFRAFLGEFAAGSDAASLAALNDICRTLEANSDVWLGWAAWAGGPWWPADYIFALGPSKSGQMRPQTEVLAKFARHAAADR
jgi:endoglucanase